MEATAERERLRRYVRRPDDAELVLTDRDLAILTDLYHARFMTTQHLALLHGVGAGLPRRLKRLWKHGYVDRPEAQRVWRMREGGGSRPLVYALANRGARALVECGITEARRRDWTERNRDLSRSSPAIPHELAVADVMVAFRRACAARSDLLFLSMDEPTSKKALAVPGGRPLYPDGTFALRRVDASGEPSLFFVELDRGSEPNTRHGSAELESLERKFSGYLAYARSRRHVEQFGVRNFRVLTITEGGKEKVANVAETARSACRDVGGRRFLTTSLSAIREGDPFFVFWHAATGEEVRLAA